MQPTGRPPVVDVALQGSGIAVAEQVDRAKVLQRLRLGDAAFRHLTRAAAITVLDHPWRYHHLAGYGVRCRRSARSALASSTKTPGIRLPKNSAPLRRSTAPSITSIIAMLIAVPVGLFIAAISDRTVPDVAAASGRHRHRAARGHSQHHLRHLGAVRVRAVSAATRAAVSHPRVRRNPGAVISICRSALRHRHSDSRLDPRDHGAALHHLDFARRVRSRAAGAQGGGLRPWLHDVGSRRAMSCCPMPASASSAA